MITNYYLQLLPMLHYLFQRLRLADFWRAVAYRCTITRRLSRCHLRSATNTAEKAGLGLPYGADPPYSQRVRKSGIGPVSTI